MFLGQRNSVAIAAVVLAASVSSTSFAMEGGGEGGGGGGGDGPGYIEPLRDNSGNLLIMKRNRKFVSSQTIRSSDGSTTTFKEKKDGGWTEVRRDRHGRVTDVWQHPPSDERKAADRKRRAAEQKARGDAARARRAANPKPAGRSWASSTFDGVTTTSVANPDGSHSVTTMPNIGR